MMSAGGPVAAGAASLTRAELGGQCCLFGAEILLEGLGETIPFDDVTALF